MKSLKIMIQTGTVDTYCPQSSQIGHISGTILNGLSFSRCTDANVVEESLVLLLLLLLEKTFMAYLGGNNEVTMVSECCIV